MRRKMYIWIAVRLISRFIMVALTLFMAGYFTRANAQNKPEVRLVL